jgi:translation initiation factor 1 (eIF-1/SUI1)
MNPFEDIEKNTEEIKENDVSYPELWIESQKRINTYLSGWNLTETQLKEHLRIIKKKLGCNGSIKKNENDDFIFHLQGDQKNYLISYLKLQGVDNIRLRIT